MKRYLIAGMSHVESLRRGWSLSQDGFPQSETEFVNLRCYRRPLDAAPDSVPRVAGRFIEPEAIVADFNGKAEGIDAAVLCINGNEHNIIGMVEIEGLEDALRIVGGGVRRGLEHWVALLRPLIHGEVMLLVPPPPIEDEQHIRTKPGAFAEKIAQYPLRAAADRLKLWQRQVEVTQQYGRQHGIEVLMPPPSVFSATGFLAPDCLGADPTHGNNHYGKRVISHVVNALQAIESTPQRPRPGEHPYAGLPDYAYWKQSISNVGPDAVDPVVHPRFLIKATDKVATAGSCFAQHISKRLRAGGFHFLLTEQAGIDEASAQGRGFYDFSARYGNIYTARQLLQLFDRAFGYFQPIERTWPRLQGGFCDPFRPRIEPDGFPDTRAVIADTQGHLAAVRRMFKELDVFVFTLGLTECWISRLDGAAYPVAPGVAGGQHDPAKHAFVNFGVSDVVSDLDAFLSKLKLVNPRARVLLTVSPVPLVATREDQHVLVSSTYSKSVLRVAAAEVVARHSHVEYFPSYEIITGPHARGGYFGPDRRSVTDAGVDHVMRVFMARMTTGAASGPASIADDEKQQAYADMQAAADTACDEELYTRDDSPA